MTTNHSMNRPISIRELRKQTKFIVTILSIFVVLLGASIDMFTGVDSKKVDTNPPVTTQVGQLPRVNLQKVENEDRPVTNAKVARVVRVVDGDTIVIQNDMGDAGSKLTLRLIGMNTPETVDPRKKVECFGKESSAKAKELLLGKSVRLEYDASQGVKDKYGRTLAYVYIEADQNTNLNTSSVTDEIFFNKYMIEQGYAYEYTYSKPYKYQIEFKAAQKDAEEGSVGLWATSACRGV